MRIRRLAASLAATALAGTALVGLAPAASATTGTTSLASVLAADGSGFDGDWHDFDIVDNAVAAVLAAKPSSPVAVLADGAVPLTAFLPTDRAFQRLVKDLTHHCYGSEEDVFTALAGAVGIDAIEQVLLYHVVPGATIESAAALASDGAVLSTAQGGTITVDVRAPKIPLVVLRDADRDARDPRLVPSALDINAGNKQIAHGITLVLRPVDL
ncbi:fasciclin domain-containing protein [Quadrisphaera sp. KR29]|uniref:fasciclin domain-containing protein n=1 Tax=Quadrisphaera sp. KR29 TaxID=3461391 RepID=UPI004044B135